MIASGEFFCKEQYEDHDMNGISHGNFMDKETLVEVELLVTEGVYYNFKRR